MKPIPTIAIETAPLLAFGAHPDDIEFGCGAVIACETKAGRPCHMIVCSRGEAASHGTPEQRTNEAQEASAVLGAQLEFMDLDGDAHLEVKLAHTLKLALKIRELKPAIVLVPSLVENQHPDHFRLGQLVRDAARLARYGGVRELKELPSHAIHHLFFYAVTSEAEPRDISPVLIDVSPHEILEIWKKSMEAHASQTTARNYVELQMTRARLHGARAGIGHAIPLFPNDPLVLENLGQLTRGARFF
ncbi:MAG: LmbE family protein [Verrucomicrobiales bacterium]|jgi:LmbE family N-acetylglucosaminyl deacetylase|nr:LmbE family protein [Verrucomicrobiales bacterium]